MKESLLSVPDQLRWEPHIDNFGPWRQYSHYVVVGMGGSHLAAGLYAMLNPKALIDIHSDYYLPDRPASWWKDTLVIVYSHSGNTEEAISAFEAAHGLDLPTAVITTGGRLLGLAQAMHSPYILVPSDDVQPRMALGYGLRAFTRLIGDEISYMRLGKVADKLLLNDFEDQSIQLGRQLIDRVPVIYSSRKNKYLAYNWKIKWNENVKHPSFYNVFPELNHNEMTGFDVGDEQWPVAEKLVFVFLRDPLDKDRIKVRMDTTAQLYRDRGFVVLEVDLVGEEDWEKVFNALALADWITLYLAEQYDREPEETPMIAEFKGLIV